MLRIQITVCISDTLKAFGNEMPLPFFWGKISIYASNLIGCARL